MLAFSMVFALAACSNNEPAANPDVENNVEAEGTLDGTGAAPGTDDKTSEESDGGNAPAKDDETKPADVKKEETKPADKPESKPSQTQTQTPAQKPAQPQKPAAPSNPAPSAPSTPSTPTTPSTPANPPANDPPAPEAPNAGDAGGTVGDTLAAVWRANSSKSAEEIANAVISHSSIQFAGGVVPVEEGFLTGFDNAEIKGFKSGYMFAPAIGTIPFVGYVFELADGTDADAFVSTLKSSANPRWNICTEAEQTIAEKSGSKVFFLMCPKSFEE